MEFIKTEISIKCNSKVNRSKSREIWNCTWCPRRNNFSQNLEFLQTYSSVKQSKAYLIWTEYWDIINKEFSLFLLPIFILFLSGSLDGDIWGGLEWLKIIFKTSLGKICFEIFSYWPQIWASCSLIGSVHTWHFHADVFETLGWCKWILHRLGAVFSQLCCLFGELL